MERNTHFLTFWHELTNAINKIKNDTRRISDGRIAKKGPGTPADQLLHIIEEVIETKMELDAKKPNPEKEIDETMDILMAWLAFVHLEEYTDDEIMWSVQRTLAKFSERGWIDFK